MNILAITGSPRKGNTEFMLNNILISAKKNGAHFKIVKLKERNIKFCNGGDNCCAKTGKCDIQDDMLEIYRELENADVVIFASPTYFSNVTALMKKLMDRCNPYYFDKKLKDKPFFLLSAGGYDASIKNALECMRNFLKGIHAKEIGSYYAIADKIGDLEKNSKVIKELEDLGAKLVME